MMMTSPTNRPRRVRASSLGLALALGFFFSIVGCEAESPPNRSIPAPQLAPAEPPPSAKRELVILISIDTLRADHLGLYGHHRFTSPNLDLFALEGTVFEDASSVAPWTLPAHASMLTGLYPLGHAVVDVDTKLPEGVPTIAKLLGKNGWKTAAAVNSMWLLKKTHEVTRDFHHFLFVQDVATARLPTTPITDQAITWIRDSENSNLFLFMHYYDVHSDYASLPRFENLMVSPYEGEADGTTWQLNIESMPEVFIESCHTNFEEEKCRFGAGEAAQSVDSSTRKRRFEADDIRYLEELYDAGIRQIDTELGRFFEFLRADGLLDVARIIITSDHGEEFSDHGSFYHFATPYQEVLHVPLILRGQGIATGRRIDAPVSVVDIAPTILAWAGVSAPSEMDGVDLTPLLDQAHTEGDAEALEEHLNSRFQHGEATGNSQWESKLPGQVPLFTSIRKGPFKLVHQSLDDEIALYDLSTDPKEKTDIALQNPEITQTLRAALARRKAAFEEDSGLDNRIELEPEEVERLRALGYLIDE